MLSTNGWYVERLSVTEYLVLGTRYVVPSGMVDCNAQNTGTAAVVEGHQLTRTHIQLAFEGEER